MRNEYCNNCQNRECGYPEVWKFIDYINRAFNMDYYLEKCPDAARDSYTCDLVYKDHERDNTMYVEVKRVKFGFGMVDTRNPFVASQNGQMRCVNIIMQIIDSFDEQLVEFLDDFVFNVPLVQLSKKESVEFGKQFEVFLEELVQDEECNAFCFKYKGKKEITISFERKDNVLRKKFGDRMLYTCETSNENMKNEGNSIEEIFCKMKEVDFLKELVRKNFCCTATQKFPLQDKRPKVLLNVLTLPTGYDLFFNLSFNAIIKEFLDIQKEKFETAATEGYLLYCCDDFFLPDGNRINIRHKNALVIIPLISDKINNVIVSTDNEIFEYGVNNKI